EGTGAGSNQIVQKGRTLSSWLDAAEQDQQQRQERSRTRAEALARRQRMADACQGLWALTLPDATGVVQALEEDRCRALAAELLTVAAALDAEGHADTIANLPAGSNAAGFAADLLKLAIKRNADALDADLNRLARLSSDMQRSAWLELANT